MMLSGYKEPCPFFDTKPENVPVNILGAIQTAEEFKELKMLGLLEPSLSKLTAFEYECYKAAEMAANTIEAEEMAELANKSKEDSPTMEKFGAGPEEGTIFSNWE